LVIELVVLVAKKDEVLGSSSSFYHGQVFNAAVCITSDVMVYMDASLAK